MRSQLRTTDVVAPIAGAALFAAGLLEARRLARGGEADLRRTAMTTGPTRALAGAAMIARPALLGSMLGDDQPTAPWLVRMVGVREVVRGLATVASARGDRDPRPWLLTLSLVDGGAALPSPMR